MQDPKCRRFHRVCGDFSLCVNIGEKVTWEEEVPQVFEVIDNLYNFIFWSI